MRDRCVKTTVFIELSDPCTLAILNVTVNYFSTYAPHRPFVSYNRHSRAGKGTTAESASEDTKVMASPFVPNRPARPTRCRYVSAPHR